VTNKALLVMDVQNGIVDRIGGRSEELIATLAQTLRAARAGESPLFMFGLHSGRARPR
jgi:nicotinamidase-related amidase